MLYEVRSVVKSYLTFFSVNKLLLSPGQYTAILFYITASACGNTTVARHQKKECERKFAYSSVGQIILPRGTGPVWQLGHVAC